MKKELLPDEQLGSKLIKKGFWLYLFSFLIAPAGYLIRIIISNTVSVADVGVLFSVISLVTLLSMYNDLGLTESLQYFIPRYWVNKKHNHIKTAIFLSLFAQVTTGIIIATILWFGAPWLASHYFHSPEAVSILRYFCFYFLGINLFQILQSIFYSLQNTFAHQFVDFVRMWATVIFTVFFWLSGRGSIQWYSITWILGLAAGIIIALIIFTRKYRKTIFQGNIVWEKPMLREYLNYAFWAFLGLNVGHLFGQIIQQIIIVRLGPESAGYYANFLSLFGITMIVVGPIIGFIFPLVSELISKKDENKLQNLFNFFYSYFLVIVGVFAILLGVLGPEIALVLFNKSFIFSGELLQIGAIFTIFSTFVGFNFSVLAGMGKIKERVKMLAIAVVFITIATLLSSYWIHLYGAVLALGFGYVLLFTLSLKLIHQHFHFGINWKLLVWNFLGAGLLGLVILYYKGNWFVIDDLMRWQNLWKLILVGLGYIGVLGVVNGKAVLAFGRELKKMKEER